VTEKVWVNADAKQDEWWDCSCSITCLCGATELILMDEPSTCSECGRRWRLFTQLQLEEEIE